MLRSSTYYDIDWQENIINIYLMIYCLHKLLLEPPAGAPKLQRVLRGSCFGGSYGALGETPGWADGTGERRLLSPIFYPVGTS